jgi:hypothetical protein
VIAKAHLIKGVLVAEAGVLVAGFGTHPRATLEGLKPLVPFLLSIGFVSVAVCLYLNMYLRRCEDVDSA